MISMIFNVALVVCIGFLISSVLMILDGLGLGFIWIFASWWGKRAARKRFGPPPDPNEPPVYRAPPPAPVPGPPPVPRDALQEARRNARPLRRVDKNGIPYL